MGEIATVIYLEWFPNSKGQEQSCKNTNELQVGLSKLLNKLLVENSFTMPFWRTSDFGAASY